MGNIEKFDSMASQYDKPERIEISKIISDEIHSKVGNGEK